MSLTPKRTTVTLNGEQCVLVEPRRRDRRVIRGMVLDLHAKYGHIVDEEGRLLHGASNADIAGSVDGMLEVVLRVLSPDIPAEQRERLEDYASDREIVDAFGEALRLMDPTMVLPGRTASAGRKNRRRRGPRRKKSG